MARLPSWAEPQLATLTRERFSDPGWIFERKQHLPGNRPGPLLGYYDRDGELVYAGKVGTGFDRKTLLSLHDRLAGLERADPAFRHDRLPSPRGVHWVEPRLVGEVGFSEWTHDGQLRHPRFQGLRDDKKPAAVVREIPS